MLNILNLYPKFGKIIYLSAFLSKDYLAIPFQRKNTIMYKVPSKNYKGDILISYFPNSLKFEKKLKIYSNDIVF